MKKYIFVLLIGFVCLTSCSEHDGTIYSGDEVQALFRAKSYTYEVVEADKGTLIVKLYRGNVKGNADVQLTLTSPDLDAETLTELDFKLKSNTASFKDGENVTDVLVEYNFDAFGVTDVYKLTLAITDKNQGPLYSSAAAYGSTTLSVSQKLTFVSLGEFDFVSNFFDGDTWKQTLARAEEDPNVFRLIDCYYKGYSLTFVMDDEREEIVQFDTQPMGYDHSTYGMTSASLAAQKIVTTETATEIHFGLKFTVSAGSFGSFWEIITIPKDVKW